MATPALLPTLSLPPACGFVFHTLTPPAILQCARPPPPRRLEAQRREARALAKQLAALHGETGRLNGLLAAAAGQRSALRQDNRVLELELGAELKVGGQGGAGGRSAAKP